MQETDPTAPSPSVNGDGIEAKLKHLEFIQGAIARMSTSSFLFKGWAITIAAGLSAFAATSTTGVLRVALIGAILSSVLFWGLDGYYLWIERRYVVLYNRVAAQRPCEIDFSMQTDKSNPVSEWFKICFRPHLWVFYGAIIIGEAVGLGLIKGT
jgi:hypothetical protein